MLVAARAVQGVGAALAAPGVLALLTTSAPDEAARNRGPRAVRRRLLRRRHVLGLLLGGVVTDIGSWRWTMFINVPIGLAVLLAGAALRRPRPRAGPGASTSSAPCRATGRRGRDRLGADRRARARLDLRPHRRRASSSALRCSPSSPSPSAGSRTRCSGPRCCATAAGSARLAVIGPGRRRAAVDVLPGRAVRPERARLRPAGLRLRVPAAHASASSRCRGSRRGCVARFGPMPLMLTGALGLIASFVWLSTARRRRHLRRRRSSARCSSTAPSAGAGLHADHALIVLGGVEPEHAGGGLRAAADHAAARRRGRPGGDRVGVRRGRGPGRVPAGRPGGVPHLGAARRCWPPLRC